MDINSPLHERVTIYFDNGYRSLRALKKFRQAEIILELPRTVVTEPDMYSIEVLPGIHLDCSDSPAGALNHSCDPNASVRRNHVIAWRCIEEGEEITIDYKKTETDLAVPFDCNCKSKYCRGRIE